MVMTMRKTEVMKPSSVRTRAKAEGSGGCRSDDDELLSWVVLLEVDAAESGEAGGDRDTSSGLGRCMRGRIVARIGQRRTGR